MIIKDNTNTICASDWINKDPPAEDPVLEGLFEPGDKTCIIGGPKTYKTWFSLQLAICISLKIEFLGFRIPKSRRVLLIQAEVRPRWFHSRLLKVLQSMGKLSTELTLPNLFIMNGRGVNLSCDDMLSAAKKCSAEVIIIDPLYKFIEGDENSAKDMKVVLAEFDRIAEQGAAVIYTHHDPKGNAAGRDTRDRGAGSNVLARDYDCCITLTEHVQSGLQVAHFLLRNYPDQPPCTLCWDDGIFSLSDIVPRVKKQKSGNPTTDQPDHQFFEAVDRIITRSKWRNKQQLIVDLRNQCDLTKDKAIKVIKAALDADKIVSNHGKGLKRKQIIYALTHADLKFAMNSIQGKQLLFNNDKQPS